MLVRDISSVMSITPADQYWLALGRGLGAYSPTMQRLGLKIEEQLGLPFRNNTGDLVIT